MVVLPDQSEEANTKLKAIYINNFIKYIEWPEDYKQGNVLVGVLGSNAILNTELQKTAESNNKKPENRKIEITNLAGSADAAKCHIVYILPDNSSQLNDVVAKVKNKSTLIVTEKPGMTEQGAGINFVIVENKLKFELNRQNIENHKLKVAAQLVNFAVNKK